MSEQKEPTSASADGKRNAYYVDCNAICEKRPYAVCLHLIERRKAGPLHDIYRDCSAHIGQKRCPAIAMRRQEVEKGVAIFFVERNKSLVTTVVEGAKAFVGKVVESVKPAPTPKKVSRAAPFIAATDYAAAINKAIEEHQNRPPVSAIGTSINPGETPLQAARRIAQEKK